VTKSCGFRYGQFFSGLELPNAKIVLLKLAGLGVSPALQVKISSSTSKLVAKKLGKLVNAILAGAVPVLSYA
jgi:hypothetical protein